PDELGRPDRHAPEDHHPARTGQGQHDDPRDDDREADHEDADLPAQMQGPAGLDEFRGTGTEPLPGLLRARLRLVRRHDGLAPIVTPRIHTAKPYPSESGHRNGRRSWTSSRPEELRKHTQNPQRGLQRHRRWHVDFADVRIPERTLSERPWRL